MALTAGIWYFRLHLGRLSLTPSLRAIIVAKMDIWLQFLAPCNTDMSRTSSIHTQYYAQIL